MSGTITICYEMRKNKIGGGEKIEQVGVRSDWNPTKRRSTQDVQEWEKGWEMTRDNHSTRWARIGQGVGRRKKVRSDRNPTKRRMVGGQWMSLPRTVCPEGGGAPWAGSVFFSTRSEELPLLTDVQ